jgi:hypothetical protein
MQGAPPAKLPHAPTVGHAPPGWEPPDPSGEDKLTGGEASARPRRRPPRALIRRYVLEKLAPAAACSPLLLRALEARPGRRVLSSAAA